MSGSIPKLDPEKVWAVAAVEDLKVGNYDRVVGRFSQISGPPLGRSNRRGIEHKFFGRGIICCLF